MKIYHLYPSPNSPIRWTHFYDTTDSVIVRAESELGARKIASSACGTEGEHVWLDHNCTICEVIHSEGEVGVILRSFYNA